MEKSHIIRKIDSLEIPELQPYLTLRRPADHIREGIFVAEGEKVVRRLIDSDLDILSFLLTETWYEALFHGGLIRARRMNPPTPVKIFIAPKDLLHSIVGFSLHQGIMAVAKVPNQIPLERLIRSVSKPHLLVALDGLVNAENVGVVVRNSSAFGADAIIVGETSSSPYLRRAVRNSMGAVFSLPVLHVENLAETLSLLKETYGTKSIAAHPHGTSSIYGLNFKTNACIVLGHEGLGVSRKVLEACTEHAAIPMLNGTDSLNVASASAVFLYEAAKQRTNPARS